jgi:hypothetical protein
LSRAGREASEGWEERWQEPERSMGSSLISTLW